MPLQTLMGGLEFPNRPMAFAGGPNVPASAFTLDAASEKAALVFRSTVTKSIRKVHFRTGTVTTGATVDVRIETVSSAGDPSGTLFGTNTNVSHVIADANDNAWLLTAALTADAAVTQGGLVAVVIVNPAVSPGNFTIANYGDDVNSGGFPYGDLFTSSWAKQGNGCPLIYVEYSDGTYEAIYGITPNGAPINTRTFNNTSTPDERGSKFKLPFPCRVSGCWLWADTDGDYDVVLYDTDGSTILGNGGSGSTVVVGNAVTNRSANQSGFHYHAFKAAVTLAKDVFYRLTVLPTTTTSLIMYDFDVPTVAMLDMFSGGQNMHATERTDAGAWTDTPTQRAYLGLFVDQLDDGVSALADYQLGM